MALLLSLLNLYDRSYGFDVMLRNLSLQLPERRVLGPDIEPQTDLPRVQAGFLQHLVIGHAGQSSRSKAKSQLILFIVEIKTSIYFRVP